MKSWGNLCVLLALVLLQGCVAGYNSALFATRSNIGFDADVGPPANLEIAISRYEGVLQPTFEGGQTVPVIASMVSGSGSLTNFFWGVNSVFATGEAAYTMSYLYDDPNFDRDTKVSYEPVTLSQEPAPTVFGATVNYIRPGEAKPVVFATDTTLGIKIRWSGQTAQYPSSANIGFKRKEGTFAPIAVGPNRVTDPANPNNIAKKPLEADVASLLATLETGVTAPDTNATFNYVQYFATGSAANNLAKRNAVRIAMLKRADPGQQIQKAIEAGKVRETNWVYIRQITTRFKNADDNKKNTILTKATDLLGDTSMTADNFPKALGKYSDKPEFTEKLKTLSEEAAK